MILCPVYSFIIYTRLIAGDWTFKQVDHPGSVSQSHAPVCLI